MTVNYAGKELTVTKLNNFQRRSPIVDKPKNSDNVILTIPVTDVNDNLFIEPFQECEIIIDGFTYYYEINSEPVKSANSITLNLVPKLMKEMSVKMNALYSAYNDNPIDIVTELLYDYNISYDRYSFAMAKDFFSSVKFEAGFSPDFIGVSVHYSGRFH